MSRNVSDLRSTTSSHSKIQTTVKPSKPANQEEASKSQHAEAHENSTPELGAGSRFLQALGIQDPDFWVGLAKQLVAANSDGKHRDEINLNFDLAFMRGVKPRDQIEAALAMQMSIAHRLIVGCARRFSTADTPHELDLYERVHTKLSRTFLAQIGALKLYRSSDEPGVTVQNVSIRDGGQAIVGQVTQQGRAAPETPAPSAIADGGIAPMPLVTEQEPKIVAARRKREE